MNPLLALSLALLLTTPEEPKEPKKPKLILTVSPRIGIASLPSGTLLVRFRASIIGPITEEWYCPRVEWHWSDQTISVEESDCPPWEDGLEGDTSWPRPAALGPGTHLVRVRLLKGDRVIARAEVVIDVK